jgi:hypothetical protein
MASLSLRKMTKSGSSLKAVGTRLGKRRRKYGAKSYQTRPAPYVRDHYWMRHSEQKLLAVASLIGFLFLLIILTYINGLLYDHKQHGTELFAKPSNRL